MKKFLAMLLALAMVFALAACGSSTTGAATEATAAPADTASAEAAEASAAADNSDRVLRAAACVTSEWFNPLVYGMTDKLVMHSLFDTLLKIDNDGNIVENLADSWESDGTTATFHLRDGVCFTDGNPVTASDVVFSFNTICEDPSLCYNMTMWASAAEAVDDSTVVFTLANNYCKYENFCAELLYIIEEATYDASADFATVAPTGSGAYTLVGQDEAGTVTLTANENYWNGAPAIKTVEVVHSMDSSTALVALQTGELDFATMVGLSTYTQAAAIDGVVASSFDSWSNMGLMTLGGDVPFQQAVAYAIDKQTVVDICNDGNGAPSTNLYAAKVMGEYADVVPTQEYDVEAAKAALANTTVDLSQTYAIEVFDDDSANAAQCVQQDLAAIGINCEVVQEDSNTWFNNLMAGTMMFGMAAMGTDMVCAPDMLTMFLPLAEGGYYENQSDELYEAVRAILTADADSVHDAIVNALQICTEAAPWVSLYDSPTYQIYSADLQGVLDSSSATYVVYFSDMSWAD